MEVVLAFGGGGVKGAAHVGVLRVLDREGYHIKGIAGTSAGAMIAAFYCAGHSVAEIEDRLTHLDQNHMYQRRAGDGPSFLGVSGAAALIKSLVGNRTFEELQVPLAVTATNLDSGEGVVIRSGPVFPAILASIAVPGVFPVQKLNGSTYVDGGVIRPVPVAPARALAPDLPVIAVALSPAHNEWDSISAKRGLFASIPVVGNLAERLIWAQALEIFMRSVDIAGLVLTDTQLRMESPEVLIRPNIHHIGLIDKIDLEKVIMAGELSAIAALPDIRRAVHPGQRARATKSLARWIAHRYPGLVDELLRINNGT
jgi:NTE family protein